MHHLRHTGVNSGALARKVAFDVNVRFSRCFAFFHDQRGDNVRVTVGQVVDLLLGFCADQESVAVGSGCKRQWVANSASQMTDHVQLTVSRHDGAFLLGITGVLGYR